MITSLILSHIPTYCYIKYFNWKALTIFRSPLLRESCFLRTCLRCQTPRMSKLESFSIMFLTGTKPDDTELDF